MGKETGLKISGNEYVPGKAIETVLIALEALGVTADLNGWSGVVSDEKPSETILTLYSCRNRTTAATEDLAIDISFFRGLGEISLAQAAVTQITVTRRSRSASGTETVISARTNKAELKGSSLVWQAVSFQNFEEVEFAALGFYGKKDILSAAVKTKGQPKIRSAYLVEPDYGLSQGSIPTRLISRKKLRQLLWQLSEALNLPPGAYISDTFDVSNFFNHLITIHKPSIPEIMAAAVISAVKAPPDLAIFHTEAAGIRRYMGYAEGIFFDNTAGHTVRCINRTNRPEQLPSLSRRQELNRRLFEVVQRILWLHDLPEIFTGDYLAPDKDAHPELAAAVSEEELAAAHQHFSPKDEILLLAFNQASAALKEGQTTGRILPEAVIAKIIDIVDGNEFFHWSLARWVASASYDPAMMPNEKALVYTMDSYQRCRASLTSLGLNLRCLKVTTALLVNQLAYVTAQWQRVPPERIPPILAAKLKWIEAELQEAKATNQGKII
ncbi:MAG TPA: hypothetical protein VMW41_05810 [Candidatus Bathyarchaeia archaeon]|nr:hypothetical protein [Candidatus Bathyarchaeia archaeon]